MTLTRLVALLALLGSWVPGSASETDDIELSHNQQQALKQALGPRPAIHDYIHQGQFVTELLAWQRQKTALAAKLANGGSSTEASPPPQSNWHHVTGPEDLDTALRNAQGYQQPNYRDPVRYNRTTHLSFPLEPLPRNQLSEKALSGQRATVSNTAQEGIPEQRLADDRQRQRELANRQPTPQAPSPELNRQH